MKHALLSILLLFAFNLHSNTERIYLDIFISDQAQVSLSSESSFNIFSDVARYVPTSQIDEGTLNISVSRRVLSINNRQFGSEVWIVSEEPIAFNNVPYAGEFLLSIVGHQIRVINRVDLEQYVAGVVPAEIGGLAPIEALKAQAIATRTFTINMLISGRHSADGFDLCNSVHCQVYRGLENITPESARAVRETEAMILLFENHPIQAFYSSNCGGITEKSGNIWSVQQEYLMSVTDNYCINLDLIPQWSHHNLNWERSFTIRELENMFSVRNIEDIQIVSRNSSSRVEEIEISARRNKITITGQYDIRDRFELRSTLFFIKREGDNVIFMGNGHGHGVGMCQSGAIARANSGYFYEEILLFYYVGTEICGDWIRLNYEL